MPVTMHGEKKAHDFLKTHKVGVLATVDPNGEPHAAAIYYFADNEFAISFVTKAKTKKANNLRHNDHAVLVVYDAATQTTVEIIGSVSEVTDVTEANRVFTKVVYASLETSHSDLPPITKVDAGDYVTFRLTPKQIRMAVFSHPKSGDYNSIFTTFTPAER